MANSLQPNTLRVANFAQIRKADIEFGDLTVLVGPQGTGKSLVLQLWKLCLDAREIVPTLREAGHDVKSAEELLDVYFGQGMRYAWGKSTTVHANGRLLDLAKLGRVKTTKPGSVFYIPAHRALLLAEGWPAPFLKLNADTPTVARLFSQNLYTLFASPRDRELFPVTRRLKQQYRDAIDAAVFHGGQVRLDEDNLRKRLELKFGRSRLPFMTWTAGQREFTPLMLGLYHLLPSQSRKKQPDIDWVIIEEPEMGLHPQAILVVMLLVLDLLWRGYRVVISTHSPIVLDVVFLVRELHESSANPSVLAKAFQVPPTGQIPDVMKAALQKIYRTFYLRFDGDHVSSEDISALDPGGERESESGWGGLTAFSSHLHEALAEAVNA